MTRRFVLIRRSDSSRMSTAVVAHGIQLADGTIALRWTCSWRAITFWDCVDDMIAVHGGRGRTDVRWLDPARWPAVRVQT